MGLKAHPSSWGPPGPPGGSWPPESGHNGLPVGSKASFGPSSSGHYGQIALVSSVLPALPVGGT